MKICSKCLIEKGLRCFYKNKVKKDGLSGYCIGCSKIQHRKYREENVEKLAIKSAEFYRKNIEEIKIRVSKQRKGNRGKINEYIRSRRKVNLNFKYSTIIRNIAHRVYRGETKPMKSIELLGCTLSELRAHLESRFLEGMTHENHGKWHIDHIRPIASFNLTDIEQRKACCHYTNLQPLWAIDNLKKGDSYVPKETEAAVVSNDPC